MKTSLMLWDRQMDNMKQWHKYIYCSPKNYELVKNRFPKNKVVAHIYCDDEFVIYNRKYPRGIFAIRIEDWSIWIPSHSGYFIMWRQSHKGYCE